MGFDLDMHIYCASELQSEIRCRATRNEENDDFLVGIFAECGHTCDDKFYLVDAEWYDDYSPFHVFMALVESAFGIEGFTFNGPDTRCKVFEMNKDPEEIAAKLGFEFTEPWSED